MMDKPWYRRFFPARPEPILETARSHAERGDAEAQFAMGLACSSRPDDSRDFVAGAEWYRKAAGQNHSLAQFNLGVMYARGQGVPRDDAQSALWMRRAAEAGDAGAQFNLGIRCHRQSINPPLDGVSESKIESYKWLHLAAEQGYIGSITSREHITFGMSREEVVEARRRAVLFAPSSPGPVPSLS